MVFTQRAVLQGQGRRQNVILRYNETKDEWSLESAFDGAELFGRPDVEVVTVGVEHIREAERRIADCEACRSEHAQIL